MNEIKPGMKVKINKGAGLIYSGKTGTIIDYSEGRGACVRFDHIDDFMIYGIDCFKITEAPQETEKTEEERGEDGFPKCTSTVVKNRTECSAYLNGQCTTTFQCKGKDNKPQPEKSNKAPCDDCISGNNKLGIMSDSCFDCIDDNYSHYTPNPKPKDPEEWEPKLYLEHDQKGASKMVGHYGRYRHLQTGIQQNRDRIKKCEFQISNIKHHTGNMIMTNFDEILKLEKRIKKLEK
jgi:hypothetical protein